MALTTLQFWQQQLTIYQAEQAAAQGDLAAAQALQKAATAQLAIDLKALDQVGSSIAAMRAQLAVTTVPADANALITQITAQIIAQRGLQGAVLDDQDALDAATASVDAANATLGRATARASSVQATIAKVTTEDAQRQSLKQAIAAAPLSTLKANATTFLGSATVTNATTRLGKNFPAKIITMAGKRHDSRSNRLASLQTVLDNAQDALGTELATDGGLQGAATQKQIGFQRAQSVLSQYVATAANRFSRAQAVTKMLEAIEVDVTGTVPDVLTDAEKTQLTALSAAGAAAEVTAESIDADLDAIFAAQDALDAQILTQINTDVDKLSTDPTVAAKRGAITAAVTAYKTAITNFAAADKGDLDQWEAVIPDAAWKVLLDYEEAIAALNELSAADPVALAAAMDAAENAYTTALAAAGLAQRRVDYIGDEIALGLERLDSAQAAIANRLLSAIRGDSY
jgi:hypothetical protein